jgi:hypothetical protein
MAKAARGGGALRIGSVLGAIGTIRVPPSVEASPVAARDWEAAVGSRIAARARPVKLDRGVLTVRAATSTWAQELSMLGDAILEQLRGRGVRARSLRFVVGQVDAPERPPTRATARTSPTPAELPREVVDVLAAVEDDALRDAIAIAAGKNLGWQAAAVRARVTAGRRGAPAPPRAGGGTDPSDRSSPRPSSGARRTRGS